MSKYKEDGWKELDPKEAIKAAQAEVSALCKGKRWQMCIPPQNEDSDIIITGALLSAGEYIKQLEEQLLYEQKMNEALARENVRLSEQGKFN